MIKITASIILNESDIQFTFIRAPGPGGQNVNKVATAVLLRFDMMTSSIPENVRQRAILFAGNKMTSKGDLIIKASRFRTQERNKQDAINRLKDILIRAAIPPKKRKKTKPTYNSIKRRLETKKLHAKTKKLRGNKFIKDA